MILVAEIENELKGAAVIYTVTNPVRHIWHCVSDVISLCLHTIEDELYPPLTVCKRFNTVFMCVMAIIRRVDSSVSHAYMSYC